MAKKSLDERLRQSVGEHKQHGSFAPAIKAPEKVEEHIPELRELVGTPDATVIMGMVIQYREYQLAEKEAAALRAGIAKQLKIKLTELDLGKFQVEDLRVNYYNQRRGSIKKALLLSNNVRPEIIEASTEYKDTPTLTVRGVSDPREEWES